jgi:hypothetical protein
MQTGGSSGDVWSRGVNHLQGYLDTFGHLKVAARYVCPDEYALGRWVAACRTQRRHGRLSATRIETLSALGFIWATPQDRWAEAVAQLTEFREQHGHLVVPIDYVTSSGFHLGEWVQKRRSDYPAHRLPRGRVLELNRLGFDWSRPRLQKASKAIAGV